MLAGKTLSILDFGKTGLIMPKDILLDLIFLKKIIRLFSDANKHLQGDNILQRST